ncbi:MAG TPA: tetratricopeptide repeat protein, partial [Candidatus Limnocylindrales bacterium]|nr:tetratricopeptide repeat protein [Candidatus Limnocylindrales bacterium]
RGKLGCIMRKGFQLIEAVLVIVVFLLGSASAQQGGAAGSKTVQPKAPTRVTPTPTVPPQTFYYSGKVVMDTGMAPPSPVAILRICNSSSRRETFTSGDGGFSFVVGDRAPSMMPDASEDTRSFGSDSQTSRNDPMTTGQNNFSSPTADCELRADLSGYSSSSIRLDASMNNTNVGVIVLHSRGKKVEGMVSVASMQVPAKARKEYEKGSEALEKGSLADAEKLLRKAIEEYPKFAEAWLRLGDLEQRRKNMEGATSDFQEAINADPNFALPYLRMAFLSAVASNWEQTHKLTERLLALDPINFPLGYYYNAVAEFNLNHLPQAETNALRAESLDKLHSEPRVELLLASIYTAKGAPAAAADHYRAYLKLVPDGPLNERVKADLAKTEAMANSRGATASPVNK